MNQTKILGTATITFSVAVVVFLAFWLPAHVDPIIQFSQEHKILAPLAVVLWRILGVVIPPIPGGVVSFALIPVLGWFWSFVYGSLGLLMGACIAFWLARRMREPLATRLVPLQQLQEWEEKLSEKMEFLTFLGIRFATGPVMDFISYVAGVSKISFAKFFTATFLALLPDVIPYYVGGQLYRLFSEKNTYLGFLVLLGLAAVLYVLRKQKFFGGKKGGQRISNPPSR